MLWSILKPIQNTVLLYFNVTIVLVPVWDLGGQTSIRPYWRCYYANTDAIIYVVDSADRDRLAISKSELVSMLEVRPTSPDVSCCDDYDCICPPGSLQNEFQFNS